MVENMMKLTLLFRPAARDAFLSELQKLGVVHVEQRAVEDNRDMTRLGERIARVVQHGEFLKARAKKLRKAPPVAAYEGAVEDLAARVDRLRARLDEGENQRAQLEKEYAAVERWGEFDAKKIESLKRHGLRVTFHSAPLANADLIAERMENDPSRSCVRLFRERSVAYFAVVGPQDDAEPVASASEERLPARSASAVKRLVERAEEELAETGAEIDSLLPYREALEPLVVRLQNELSYKLAAASVKEEGEGNVFLLTGWIPERTAGELEEFLRAQEAVHLLEKPGGADNVPVLLRSNFFARLFQPILRIFSLPDYRELDPTPFFAPFYTIFFGLCVADMGYGLLILVAAFAALLVIKRKALRPLLSLAVVLGASVMAAGFLLNDFFGLNIVKLFGPHSGVAQAVLFGDINSAMYLALTLGIIQVTFGWALRAINQGKRHGAPGALKPAGVVLMLIGLVLTGLPAFARFLGSDIAALAIGPIPVGAAIAGVPHGGTVGLVLIAAGFLLFLLFDNLKAKIYARPAIGLWHFYEFATGVLGDILSYMRLFALGLSGGLLGEAIINLALMAKGNSAWGIIPMILILLVGTFLNLAIGLLSAFVHSLRLTFVEFYKSVGFKGGGVEYRPFRIKS